MKLPAPCISWRTIGRNANRQFQRAFGQGLPDASAAEWKMAPVSFSKGAEEEQLADAMLL